jgi:hypothetical protein
MQSLMKIRAVSLAVCGSLLLATSAPVFAQHAGGHVGGGGVARGGYGGHAGGFGYRGGYGFRGGYGYGFRGGYGWRGYGGFYGPWGWGLGGLGLGLYFATLPYYYSTYWWGGVPYYYADNTYYRWDAGVGQYQTVAPPVDAQNQGGAPTPGAPTPGAGYASSSELIAYPKNGQSQEQQGKDKFECHHWAAEQTGFDPSQGAGAGSPAKRPDYQRAQAACLEGRGYSVR